MGVQELAKYLKIAPITIYRKVKAKEMPFFKVGRHLKFSQEAIDHWMALGITTSVTEQQPSHSELIEHIKQTIVSELHPQKIILFGSYGYGKPTPESDIDLCIVHPTVLQKRKRARIVRDILASFLVPFDIVVYTPDELEQWKDVPGGLIRKILDTGKVIYDEKNIKDVIQSWIEKAEHDLIAARVLLKEKESLSDVICIDLTE